MRTLHSAERLLEEIFSCSKLDKDICYTCKTAHMHSCKSRGRVYDVDESERNHTKMIDVKNALLMNLNQFEELNFTVAGDYGMPGGLSQLVSLVREL